MVEFVIQFFVPLSTHSSPSRTAVVRIDAGSLPASGSLSANAGEHSPLAHLGSHCSFCSSVPNSWIGSVPSSWTMRISALEAHARATSSTATLSINVPVPVPPYSTGNGSPSRSCSANSLRMSHGYSLVASISAARGATFSVTICRIVSRKSLCSAGRSYVSDVAADGALMPRMVLGAAGHPIGHGNRNIHSPDRRWRDPQMGCHCHGLGHLDPHDRHDPAHRRHHRPDHLAAVHGKRLRSRSHRRPRPLRGRPPRLSSREAR